MRRSRSKCCRSSASRNSVRVTNKLPKLFPIGWQASRDPLPADPFPTLRAKVSAAATLGDLQQEYAFFSPALLYLKIAPQHDPFHDFCREQGRQVHLIRFEFLHPVFTGLEEPIGDTHWNHTLLALELPDWNRYRSFVGTLAFRDRAAGRLTRVRLQDLVILDPVVRQKAAVAPTRPALANVAALVLDTNHGCWCFDSRTVPPAAFLDSRAYPDTVRFADSLLSDQPDPYGDSYPIQPPESQ